MDNELPWESEAEGDPAAPGCTGWQAICQPASNHNQWSATHASDMAFCQRRLMLSLHAYRASTKVGTSAYDPDAGFAVWPAVIGPFNRSG
jgi:hypothetical protein